MALGDVFLVFVLTSVYEDAPNPCVRECATASSNSLKESWSNRPMVWG